MEHKRNVPVSKVSQVHLIRLAGTTDYSRGPSWVFDGNFLGIFWHIGSHPEIKLGGCIRSLVSFHSIRTETGDASWEDPTS